MEHEKDMPRGCRMVGIRSVRDARGGLAFAEGQSDVPFPIRRVFWIYDIPEGAQRGGHAHSTCAEVVVPVCGAFTMVLDDGERRVEVRMTRPDEGVLVPPAVWCELKDFETGTVLVVMASHPYDASGYVNDYDEYRGRSVSLPSSDKKGGEE